MTTDQGHRDDGAHLAALAIVEKARALWAKSADNYECSAPHDTGAKAACVAARDALSAVAAEIRELARGVAVRGELPSEPIWEPNEEGLDEGALDAAVRQALVVYADFRGMLAAAIQGYLAKRAVPVLPSEPSEAAIRVAAQTMIRVGNSEAPRGPALDRIYERAARDVLRAAYAVDGRAVPPSEGEPT